MMDDYLQRATKMSETNGRDQLGRFTRGNKYSSARRKESVAAWNKAIKTKDIKSVARKLLELALHGNIKACIYILDRSLGKPEEYASLDDKVIENPEQLKARIVARIKEFEEEETMRMRLNSLDSD